VVVRSETQAEKNEEDNGKSQSAQPIARTIEVDSAENRVIGVTEENG
jgi:hypothetical protein